MPWTDRAKGGSKDPCNVALMLEAGVVAMVVAVLDLGALVSFGVSRDGGSMSCTVTFNGVWDREWFREPQELHDWLHGVAVALEAEPPPPAGASSNGAPRRGR